MCYLLGIRNKGDRHDVLPVQDAPTAGFVDLPGIETIDCDLPEPARTAIRTDDTSCRTRVDTAVQTQVHADPSSPVHQGRHQTRYRWSPSPAKYYHHSVSDDAVSRNFV